MQAKVMEDHVQEESNKLNLQESTLPFRIVEASSEDPSFKTSELVKESGKGWHTAPDAPYPQYVIIQPIIPTNTNTGTGTGTRTSGSMSMTSDSNPTTRGLHSPSTSASASASVEIIPVLSKLQLLVHETRIPRKIELFISVEDAIEVMNVKKKEEEEEDDDDETIEDGNEDGHNNDHKLNGHTFNNNESHANMEMDTPTPTPTRTRIDTMQFKRLGYISLDNNEKTGYRARELKSIPLGNVQASFLKLVIHGCHGQGQGHGHDKNDANTSINTGRSNSRSRSSSSNKGGGGSSSSVGTTHSRKNNMNPHGQIGIVSMSLFGTYKYRREELKRNPPMMSSSSSTMQRSSKQRSRSPKRSPNVTANVDGSSSSVTKKNDRTSASVVVEDGKILSLDEHLEKNNPLKNNELSYTKKVLENKQTRVGSVKNEVSSTCIVRAFCDMDCINRINSNKSNERYGTYKDCVSFFQTLDWSKVFNPSGFNVEPPGMKELLLNMMSLFKKVDKSNLAIQDAVTKESYLEASRLKDERDTSRQVLLHAISNMEGILSSSMTSPPIIPTPTCTPLAICETTNPHSHSPPNLRLEDLSLSTIRRIDNDDDSVAMTMASRTHAALEDRPIRPMKGSEQYSDETGESTTSDIDESDDIEDPSPLVDEDGKHPLEGVPKYLDLPHPEDIHKSRGGSGGLSSSLNSSANSHTSSDFSKVERILGSYLTRCFLSKSWALREAALIKLSLILKERVTGIKDDPECERNGWWSILSKGLCVILERAMDDRIVQVFLTGLILLDDCVTEFEIMDVSQRDTINLLSNVILNLVGKLTDGNPKVAEGSETALMSMALSDIVGPSYISSQVMKQMSSKESKTAKSVARRCLFLKALLEEFNTLSGSAEKMMKFVHTFGLLHPQVEARDAAKSLVSLLYLRDKKVVLSMMDGLSDRQIKEYKVAFATAKAKENGKGTSIGIGTPIKVRRPPSLKTTLTQGSTNTNHPNLRDCESLGIAEMLHMPMMPEESTLGMEPLKTPGRRGRGRGRSRRLSSQPTPNSKHTSAKKATNRFMDGDILHDFPYD